MIDLSEKYNPCLNLVYIYLMINRNMLGKANTSILDIQKDIFKTKNQSIIQKRTDEILEQYPDYKDLFHKPDFLLLRVKK